MKKGVLGYNKLSNFEYTCLTKERYYTNDRNDWDALIKFDYILLIIVTYKELRKECPTCVELYCCKS
jgi:hypothetical protein